jgi:hypothetical protein
VLICWGWPPAKNRSRIKGPPNTGSNPAEVITPTGYQYQQPFFWYPWPGPWALPYIEIYPGFFVLNRGGYVNEWTLKFLESMCSLSNHFQPYRFKGSSKPIAIDKTSFAFEMSKDKPPKVKGVKQRVQPPWDKHIMSMCN